MRGGGLGVSMKHDLGCTNDNPRGGGLGVMVPGDGGGGGGSM